MESLGADAVWWRPATVPVAKSVLIVQLSAAVTAGHRKAESFFTAFQRTPTGKVTSRITLFNINLDRVSLAVACTNNSSRYRPCSGSGSSHCHWSEKTHCIISDVAESIVAWLPQAVGNSLLSNIMSIILSMWILFSTYLCDVMWWLLWKCLCVFINIL